MILSESIVVMSRNVILVSDRNFMGKFIRWVSIIGVEMKFGCSSRGLFHFIFIASIKSNQEIGWWRKPQEKFEDTKGIDKWPKEK
jgi:hypothetical protein